MYSDKEFYPTYLRTQNGALAFVTPDLTGLVPVQGDFPRQEDIILQTKDKLFTVFAALDRMTSRPLLLVIYRCDRISVALDAPEMWIVAETQKGSLLVRNIETGNTIMEIDRDGVIRHLCVKYFTYSQVGVYGTRIRQSYVTATQNTHTPPEEKGQEYLVNWNGLINQTQNR